MDPDMEFNALSALYQSVVQDMKHSYPAWETVGQRATKLSQQLRTTVQCLSSFVDAVQSVSDYANNLKGASRDVGACVTRVCMRERALETRLRSVADALSDELALGIQQRTGYWRQRTSELDKNVAKHIKKVRGRKGRPDPSALSEQRKLCSQVLLEQRSQFAFFIGTLMPVLQAELGALDEGPHIRQVVETLEDTVKCVDGAALVETMVSDLSQGADNAWRQCLASANRSFRHHGEAGTESGKSSRAVTPNSTFTDDNDMTPMGVRPHTISAMSKYSQQHAPLNNQTFAPPSSSTSPPSNKPPLQRRPSEKSLSKHPSPTPPHPHHHHHHEMSSLCHLPPSAYRSSQYDIASAANGRIQRPQSFTGELKMNYQQQQSSCYGTPIYPAGSSSCSSSDAASSSAALIAETLQQIDQLGSDLENYCVSGGGGSSSSEYGHLGAGRQSSSLHKVLLPPPPQQQNGTSNGYPPPHPGISSTSSLVNGVRIRSESSSRPPPPARRSSTITAATPTAPSVAEARMSMGSVMGSRQSLNSSGVYCMGSNPDLRYPPNVNPYTRQTSQSTSSQQQQHTHFKI